MAKVYWRISFFRRERSPVALEVAAHYANTEERDKRQVTKDNSTIMARDKGM